MKMSNEYLKYTFVFLAFLSYFIFLLISIFRKIGKSESPIYSFNKLHFHFSFLFLFLSFITLYLFFPLKIDSLLEVLIGFFYYYGIHYAIFLNFFSLAQRSISASILILLEANKGSLSVADISKRYADGKGFSYIKESRIQDMLNLGLIEQKDKVYQITHRGKRTSILIQFFLRCFNLRQLGK